MKIKTYSFYALIVVLLFSIHLQSSAQRKKKSTEPEKEEFELNERMIGFLKFRSIGPAAYSGRISDLAVNPENTSEYYVGVASGGLWKTENHGTTFKPIFDNQPVFSIGCLAMDPNNTKVVWVGTGENNSQRNWLMATGFTKLPTVENRLPTWG